MINSILKGEENPSDEDRDQLKVLAKDSLKVKTQVVNQIKALIGLKNDLNTTDDYLNTLRKDYSIKTSNEDGKIVTQSV